MNTSNMVIFLVHGYGSTGKQMKELFSSYLPVSEGYELIPLEAPHVCDLFPDRKQWFKLSYLKEYLIPQIDLAVEYVENKIIEKTSLLKGGWLPYCLVGHSQGAMIGVRLALRKIVQPQTVIAISASGPFITTKNELEGIPPISIIHGQQDAMMPIDKTIQDVNALKLKGVPVQLHVLEHMQHELNQEALTYSKKLILNSYQNISL